MKKFLYILALCSFLSSCQEQDLKDPSLVIAEDGLVAYKVDQREISRSVPPNSYFPIGTYYYLWSYQPDGSNAENPDFNNPRFENDSKYNLGLPPLGKESGTHYVEVSSANKKLLNGHMHLFGLCINGDDKKETYGLADIQNLHATEKNAHGLKSIVTIEPRDEAGSTAADKTWDYYDICRGYVHYDPAAPEYATSSSFTIPFIHAMAQMKVAVVQEGEVEYVEKEDANGNVYYEAKDEIRAFDINLKSIRLCNEYKQVTYDAINHSYTRYDKLTVKQYDAATPSDQIGRLIWEDTDPSKDFPIPVTTDQVEATNIFASTLVVPQGVKPATVPDPNNPNQTVPYTEDFTSDNTNNTLWLELVISGTDAWKFDNEHQLSSQPTNGGDVTLWIPVEDNTTAVGNDPIRFLPNHSYKLVVFFHGDNVHIVTIKPQIYPWFDGERDAYDDENRFYEPSDIGSPMVFGNVQWNDRYMGSDWVAPTTLDEFVKATGFYYQNGRSIPFYPTTYDETNATLYDVNWKKFTGTPNLGTQATVTMDNAAIPYTQGSNLPIYFLAGGKWKDVSVGDMTKYPVVHPVVPYKLPSEQKVITENANDMYGLYSKEKFNWGKGDRYVCNVEDYYDKETGKINTFKLNNQDAAYIMRFIANMDKSHSDAWNDPNKHPCPPGWRLPTKDELYTILPSSPLAGNITFLRDFRVNDGSIGSADGDGKDAEDKPTGEAGYLKDGNTPVLEFYLKLPYVETTDIYPSLASGNYGSIKDQEPDYVGNGYDNKSINFPAYDPEPGDATQYVISKRKYSAEEYENLDQTLQEKVSQTKYQSYSRQIFCGKPVTEFADADAVHEAFTPREWGTIFAIKKQGTPDAYRMRWRVERLKEGYDIYQIIVDKYKCSRTDYFKYKIEDINDDHYFLNYDWDNPESTLYFPITGIVADYDMAKYLTNGGPMVYNYGTETILLTSSYVEGKPYAWAYRIKIAGTNSWSLYLYPSMERLAQGGQVRPVRTAR